MRRFGFFVGFVALGACNGSSVELGGTDSGPDAPQTRRDAGVGVDDASLGTTCEDITCETGNQCITGERGAVCEDIDECEDSGSCASDEACSNLPGSYRCDPLGSPCAAADACPDGTVCTPDGDAYDCDDIDECATANTCPTGFSCANSEGSFDCNDIDECAAEPGPCADPNETCINTDGGHRCEVLQQPTAGCGLNKAAFCETFETVHAGGRGGDLDEKAWAVSRWGIGYSKLQMFHRPLASTLSGYETQATFCGSTFSKIAVGDDFRVCAGEDASGASSKQLHEVMQDGGDNVYLNSMMVRQPFDFTGRTGVVTWEVDAKFPLNNDGHGWWIEAWISEQPNPIPYQKNFPSVDTVSKNSVGLVFQGTSPACDKSKSFNAVSEVFVSSNYQARAPNFDTFSDVDDCFAVGDKKLNRFELRISKDKLELWASDAGNLSNFRRVASATNLNLGFERGYVTFQHSQYNAGKTNATPAQTFRWDNIGFDGPVLPAVDAYDVPIPVDISGDGAFHGLVVDASFAVEGVKKAGRTKAFLNLNAIPNFDIEYRVNGGAWRRYDDPRGSSQSWTIRSHSIPVDMADLVDGKNTFDVRNPGIKAEEDKIGNIDLTLE